MQHKLWSPKHAHNDKKSAKPKTHNLQEQPKLKWGELNPNDSVLISQSFCAI